MFISRVISYRNAWENLTKFYPQALEDIRATAEGMTDTNLRNAEGPLSSGFPRRETTEIEFWKFDGCWEAGMLARGWELQGRFSGTTIPNFQMPSLGTISGPVSVRFIRHRETLNRWLFTLAPVAIRRGIVEMPIAAIMLPKVESQLRGRVAMGQELAFERMLADLQELSPLSRGEPFLILGLDLKPALNDEPEIIEIKSDENAESRNVIINRSINFPPEYHQAGLGILQYFGTVLREKCPDEDAKVTIEQDGFVVRLVIESENGNRQVIEKILQEYQMVVQGQMKPDDFFESKLKAIELKSELNIAQVRISTQQDLISHQRLELSTLHSLLGLALQRPISIAPSINFSPVITIENSQSIEFTIQQSALEAASEIHELAERASNYPSLETRMRDLEEALILTGKRTNAEEVRNSSGITKLKKFIDDAVETGTSVNSFFGKAAEGLESLQGLARRYNSIAEWCGAPTVPRILVGEYS